MKAIWRGEHDPILGLIEGKEYEILDVVWGGTMYDVTDESGDSYLYPAEDFEVTEE